MGALSLTAVQLGTPDRELRAKADSAAGPSSGAAGSGPPPATPQPRNSTLAPGWGSCWSMPSPNPAAFWAPRAAQDEAWGQLGSCPASLPDPAADGTREVVGRLRCPQEGPPCP